ncbi:MAG TPA: PepSY domain-containing protein [Mycobacterium sp.]|jgi:hypothetical protein|nr:PepSY domain-containing protein [Mycobacterium sp.]
MARLFITSALAMLVVAGAAPAIANTSDVPATTESNDNAALTEQIRAKLAEDGYKDITILPTTYAVSATDKTGKPVLLLIGPQSSTILQGTQNPSTAESPDGDKKEMQQ